MAVLVTGGAGFIGSHTVVELLKDNYEIIILDNFTNSKPEVLDRIRKIADRDFAFYEGDILDSAVLERIFTENEVDAVIHFAGLKAVGESVEQPLRYYNNNIAGTLVLLESMKKHGVKKMVFSSSATVYGMPKTMPIQEDFPLSATNPYGRTKLMIEEILHDVCASDSEWSVALLRYFNPIGAHESGLIGEDPNGIPNNLMPFITQVAVGKRAELSVFGSDYPTVDGSGVRDYIHVVDLAIGHVRAVENVLNTTGIDAYNLGTGVGYSVLEIVKAFEAATGITIPYKIVDRRPGDVAICYADPTKAAKVLGWKAERDIEKMCQDSWNWQSTNPEGYGVK